MIGAIVVALIGLGLIYLEFFLPGGIVGGIGGLLLIAGFILFSLGKPGPWGIGLFLTGTVVLLFCVIQLALWHVRKSGKRLTLFLAQDQEGYKASSFEKKMLGKQGIALTDLGPSGHVTLEGESYQAVSRSGYLQKGAKVEVVGGQGAYLIVKPRE